MSTLRIEIRKQEPPKQKRTRRPLDWMWAALCTWQAAYGVALTVKLWPQLEAPLAIASCVAIVVYGLGALGFATGWFNKA